MNLYNIPIPSFSIDHGWRSPESTSSETQLFDKEIQVHFPTNLMPTPIRDVSHSELDILRQRRMWKLQSVPYDSHKIHRLIFDDSTVSSLKKYDMEMKRVETIYDKLLDIYFSNLLDDTSRNGQFIKCNYIEELVLQKNLDHLVLKLYPRGFFFYIICHHKDPVEQYIWNVDYDSHKYYEDFFKAIDNEEIPYEIFDLLHEFCNDLMYDYHMILHIQKFASELDSAKPVFSSFVLLKPTINICTALTTKYMYDNSMEQDEQDDISKLHMYESKLFCEIAGSLYLDSDQSVLDLHNSLRKYSNPFSSNSLKLNFLMRKPKSSLDQPTIEAEKNERDLILQGQLDPCGDSTEDLSILEKPPSFLCESVQKVLHSLLASREIKLVNGSSRCLIEVFYFNVPRNIIGKPVNAYTTTKIEKRYKLAVYWEKGLFYTYSLSGRKFVPEKVLSCLHHCIGGDRENLDKYILTYASVISNGFSRKMEIRHNSQRMFFSCDGRKYDCMDFQNSTYLTNTIWAASNVKGFSGNSKDVIELSDSNFKQIVLDTDDMWLIIFYTPQSVKCLQLAPHWSEAATKLKEKVKFGAVNVTVHKVISNKYNIKKVPTIKFYPPVMKDTTAEQYNGAKTAENIIHWVHQKIEESAHKMNQGDSNDIIQLSDSNFKETVLESRSMWLVKFYAPYCSDCQKLAPEWCETAAKLNGKVKCGALDATVHTAIANKYNIEKFPTIKFFPMGIKDGSGEEYDVGKFAQDYVNESIFIWTLNKIAEYSPKEKQGDSVDVIELSDSNFKQTVLDSNDLWIVQFYAPESADCKKLSPHWCEAAIKLRGKVKFGTLNITVHKVMCMKYNVKEVPTIKLFPRASKCTAIEEYNGRRTAQDIIKWVLDKVSMIVHNDVHIVKLSHKEKREVHSSENQNDEIIITQRLRTIESKFVLTAFEAHSFESEAYKKSVTENTLQTHPGKKRIEIYPSLKSEFVPPPIEAKKFMLHLEDADEVFTPKVSALFKRIFPKGN